MNEKEKIVTPEKKQIFDQISSDEDNDQKIEDENNKKQKRRNKKISRKRNNKKEKQITQLHQHMQRRKTEQMTHKM